jgi:hypothetical protein
MSPHQPAFTSVAGRQAPWPHSDAAPADFGPIFGPDKKTLYVRQLGAVGPDGKPWKTPEGVRNRAMSISTIRMVAAGFKGRPK